MTYDLGRNLCKGLLYFLVRVQCRRKESSRSLSHLLMSFLLNVYSAIDNLQGVTCRVGFFTILFGETEE